MLMTLITILRAEILTTLILFSRFNINFEKKNE